MAILKCKMCGGDIEVNEEKTFGTCEYCGSVMTLPKVSDDQRAARFNRGNHFRRLGEFDKALGVYESIVREDDADAEAHWCCALCRFGIEYVEDPNTFEFLPTCHRASFDSFLEDVDYLAALENSDGITRRQYQKDAAKIAEVQRGILATSQNEEPFDVFICYKETDDNTKERTRDSLDAQDIYYQLTQEGYRVFFSRITLEEKVGTEYEPYIFAALNSAKVMIALGSKPEYFNAVWVKNEWSRFLAMMRKDRSKLLLPCYKDMDPYDLPEQLGVLQSYDMAKIGFMQDLIRGVKKVLAKDEKKQSEVVQQTVVQQSGGNVDSLLKRVKLFLEDREWSSAEEYCQKVLDIDPENAEAYLGLAMAKGKSRNKEDFSSVYIDGRINADDKNLRRAIQFGDENLKQWFEEIEEKRTAEEERKRIERQKQEEERRKQEEERRKQEEERRDKEKKRLASVRERISKYSSLISTGNFHTVGLKADGTVVATKYTGDTKCYFGEGDVQDWTDIVAVSAGTSHTVGLKSEGTVITVGSNKKGQCNVESWTDIVAVSAGYCRTIGLKSDGTVVAVGSNENGECNVRNWTDIVAVSAGYCHTIGLKSDGTVVAVGNNEDGQCDVYNWTDIVAVSAGTSHTVGLKADGTVVATEFTGEIDFYFGQDYVQDWTDVVAVSAGWSHTVGLKSDGTVVAVGENDEGQCNVTDWTDIVAVSAGENHTVGLKANGTVVATKYTGDQMYNNGQCDVQDWKLFKTEEEKENDYGEAVKLQNSEKEADLKKAYQIFNSIKDYKDSKEREAFCKKAHKEKKTAREERERAERAAALEAERQRKIAALNTEKTTLQTELSNLKGLFTGKRRKQIEARLAEIDNELKSLKS